MEKRDEELIRSLVAGDPELNRCYEEHLGFERELAGLRHKGMLSAEEALEERRLQKVKLAGMDRIMGILARHRSANA